MKERLIGAAVLVALGVWLIPWVLDGPKGDGESQQASLELPAPSENNPLRTQTIRLQSDRNPGRPSPVPAASPPEPTPVQIAPSPKPAAPAPAEAMAAKESTAEPAPASEPAETWLVQLGSFGDEENAYRLAERVGSYGFDAQVFPYTAGGRAMHRVRVGPESTRARAESVASSLSAHGFVAQVVPGN